ncbi:DUF3164 family protein [Bacteroides acidifaciens]|uniref:DUF3164 family protein n=1 Tax=Bacteroides acidifaciens TaxID=85831 RepID=A0A4S2B1W8_9BACE|nr:DUF3164 family protein [Bacteroides acidifaciens]TGY07492.1 DUF3164 family protein [Bacteroides acidifaciens]
MSEQVTMTAKEREEWEAYKAEKEKKEAAERRKAARATYQQMVDDELAQAVPELRKLSQDIRTVKDTVFGNFQTVLDMKAEVVGFKEDGQFSHTFTNSDSTLRLTLGVNTVDGWNDMAETGIAMVRKYIESLATDEKTKTLVNTVLRLLSKDKQGNLNASRVLQLAKMAEESNDDQFKEGVKIIQESYMPTETRRYIRAQYRDETTGNGWRNIPLGITDVDLVETEQEAEKPGVEAGA